MSPVLTSCTFLRPRLNVTRTEQHPDAVNSLPKLISFNAEKNPDHIFGLQDCQGRDMPPRKITFSQLDLAVKNAAAWLVNSGYTTGRTTRDHVQRPVAVLLGSDIGLFIYLAALLRIGTPVLCLSARLTPVAIAHLIKQTSPSTLLVSAQTSRAAEEANHLLESEIMSEGAPVIIDALRYDDFLCENGPNYQSTEIPPVYSDFHYDDLDALIMHSSGTTGLPKPVFHSQAYLLGYAACHRIPEQKSPFRINFSTLPLYHGFGFIAPCLSLSIGMPFVLPPASVIPTARYALEVLQVTGARYMMSVPSILEDMLEFPGNEALEVLKTLDILAIGGASMKESVGRVLIAKGIKLLNHWGATEIGAIAPIERIPDGYDWHYLMPRSDIGLRVIPVDDGSGTYRLIGQAPGWSEPFVVQDLLEGHPHDPKQFRILGRTDDLIIFGTGEKIRPTNLERAVAEHPDVRDVLAFGDGQLALGLLVEIAAGKVSGDLVQPQTLEAVHASLAPYLELGNSLTDKHGKVTKDMVVFTREEVKPLVRTDKGSLARKATIAVFGDDIKRCYDKLEIFQAPPFPTSDYNGALLDMIRSMVRGITNIDAFGDSRGYHLDFFEAGMDSLQAARLRRSIWNSFRATQGLSGIPDTLPSDFCFVNSSVEKLHKSIAKIMSGTYLDGFVSGETVESRRVAAMDAMLQIYLRELTNFADEAMDARQRRYRNLYTPTTDYVVVLTGSTGSLGSMLLTRLAQDPNVSKIICLNRRQAIGAASLYQRQYDALQTRGAVIGTQEWEKIVLREVDMNLPDLGLTDCQFTEVLSATHIIHNAWPVDFNRRLPSFHSQVKSLCNLIRLAFLSSGTRTLDSAPTRLLFASSIAVVGRFPLLHPQGPFDVPETIVEARNTSQFGYAEAKWVCEKVLQAASELYGSLSPDGEDSLLEVSSVRIGQMTGAEGSGAWNKSEHFPIVIQTSETLKALPDLRGSLSWMPVNRAADAITELLFSSRFREVYHLENASRQSWSGVMHQLASILGDADGPLPLIPFTEWLAQVRSLGDTPRNPAFKVIDFLQNDFIRMASGMLILRTTAAREDSVTMVRSTSLDLSHLLEYVGYWRSVGGLH